MKGFKESGFIQQIRYFQFKYPLKVLNQIYSFIYRHFNIIPDL